MKTEQELYTELSELVKVRNEILSAARSAIQAANKDFDREAIRIGRLLRKFDKDESEQKGNSPRPASSRGERVHNVAGLSQDEAEHYKQLASRK